MNESEDSDSYVKVPYLYFMDTSDLTELCPVLGQSNVTKFDIVYDDKRKISVIYKPANIAGCTRSIVFFSQSKNKVAADVEQFFSRVDWAYSEAHIFYVSDPYYYMNSLACDKEKHSNACGSYYMLDFKSELPLIHPILHKFHELLGIAFCKFIGVGESAYSALQFSALFGEIAPWTITLAVNPPIDISLLNGRTDIEMLHGGPIDWSIDYNNMKEKALKGKHLFFVVQNRMDTSYYKGGFLKQKAEMKDNLVQGWAFQTPASSFYNDNNTDHRNVQLSREVVFDFIDWMSNVNMKATEGTAGIYHLKREF